MGLLDKLLRRKPHTIVWQPAPVPQPIPQKPVTPSRKGHWCGKCHKGFYTEQTYLEHQCAARFHYKPTERMEAK